MRSRESQIETKDRQSLKAILKSTDELNRFISSILDLNKVETRRYQFEFKSNDINKILEIVVERFKLSAKSKAIKIELDLEPLFPIQVDSSLISKVFSNLIDNAIKYSKENSKIRIETRDFDRGVEVKIIDQGHGLSPIEKEKVFEKFYRVKNDQRYEVSGTGLGLYLSKYFIEAHHGTISVMDREDGSGSIFRIILPDQNFQVGLTTEWASAESSLEQETKKERSDV